jgi:hypothetical protein
MDYIQAHWETLSVPGASLTVRQPPRYLEKMKAAFYLFSIAGVIGAFDVLYYHIYTHRLYKQPSAIWENVTHFVRALLFAVFFVLTLHVEASGSWWWLYPAIIGVEVLNTTVDTMLEPSSRKSLGGLPAGEYFLHVFLSILTGAALASILWDTYPLLSAPTALQWHTLDVPAPLRFGSYGAVVMALGFFLFESSAFFKQLAQRQRWLSPAAAEPSLGGPHA